LERNTVLPSNGPKRRLLLVDQDFWDLQHYSRILEQDGFEVDGQESYEAGVASLACGNFDLVVVGQEGPEFTCRPVVAQAAQTDPSLPVLVLSHNVSWDCVLQAMRLGAVGIHRKAQIRSKLAELAMKALRPRPVEAGIA
jgi:DNA-binding NtrC family response regulator